MAADATAAVRDYATETEKLKGFLQEFQEGPTSAACARLQVHRLLQRVANRRERKVLIELDDVYEALGDEIGEAMRRNTKRYQKLLAAAIKDVMPEPTTDNYEEDVADILQRSREQRAREGTDAESTDDAQHVPDALVRRYEILIMPRPKEKAVPLRQVRASHIGELLTVKGIVTRVSEVKPAIAVATYTCAKGGFEVYQEVTGRSFAVDTCPASNCCGPRAAQPADARPQVRQVPEVKVQERRTRCRWGRAAAAHRPPQRRAHARVRRDVVTVSGIFLPVPYAGFKDVQG